MIGKKNKKTTFLLPSCITKHNNRDSGYITKNKKGEVERWLAE